MSCRSASPPPASRGTGASTRRPSAGFSPRSEEHTSELQSQSNIVCRLLLEKKKTDTNQTPLHNVCGTKNPTTLITTPQPGTPSSPTLTPTNISHQHRHTTRAAKHATIGGIA